MAQKKQQQRRVRVRDAEKSIWRPNDEDALSEYHANTGPDFERDVVVYTIFGSHDYLDEDNKPAIFDDGDIEAEDRDIAFAKVVRIDGGDPHYSVRRDSAGRILDPLGMFSERNHNKMRHHTQRRQWEWVEVNKRVFEYYVRYLETKNRAHYINAEREVF